MENVFSDLWWFPPKVIVSMNPGYGVAIREPKGVLRIIRIEETKTAAGLLLDGCRFVP